MAKRLHPHAWVPLLRTGMLVLVGGRKKKNNIIITTHNTTTTITPPSRSEKKKIKRLQHHTHLRLHAHQPY